MGYKYIFGPVFSGRIGRSLGLDLLGKRICSMDCVYCEVGATEFLVSERRPYVSAAAILEELASWKQEGHLLPDVITLGGLGEPVLNSDLPEIIGGVKKLFPSLPVAVLTNATPMTDPEVRRELLEADIVLPSMDSLVASEFRAVNRPCKGIDPEDVAKALIEFRKEFKGKIFLEVLLSRGYNDSAENLSKMKAFCSELSPDRIDVVTLSRPGTLEVALPVDPGTLDLWKKALDAAPCTDRDCGSDEGAKGRNGSDTSVHVQDGDSAAFDRIQASLMRRPQTAQQLSKALEISFDGVMQVIEKLENSGKLTVRQAGDEIYYKFKPDG
ncbi:Wyosine [tRNA(Phe)-imidazoG37] synthetase, radical SAM superfamily [Maridesulfovibrio ferrireducens]|uniref:Wyosine [tRNA(Phe)-imidazoG37] synthetase, radical SAM superfamily n=1 Tax=Maridesulfovibrio ferrireducens TaxID=246191 RepID=A0A1G9BP42_9BACT|nr:radical SAM protein [Maridesulfovibrio ferrireducens]SDK41258.1 Wyosine [tRNA(Phe)-imidazoG37] synthetase, radical SAM superfamily [Maridesulfovibrio ferrireducens]